MRAKKKEHMIRVAVAVFFIGAQITLGCYFWPKIMEYRRQVKAGKVEPVIEVRIGQR